MRQTSASSGCPKLGYELSVSAAWVLAKWAAVIFICFPAETRVPSVGDLPLLPAPSAWARNSPRWARESPTRPGPRGRFLAVVGLSLVSIGFGHKLFWASERVQKRCDSAMSKAMLICNPKGDKKFPPSVIRRPPGGVSYQISPGEPPVGSCHRLPPVAPSLDDPFLRDQRGTGG